jgi:hypothetical protein
MSAAVVAFAPGAAGPGSSAPALGWSDARSAADLGDVARELREDEVVGAG